MKRIIFCLLLLDAGSNNVSAQYWEPLGEGVQGSGIIASLEVDTFHNTLYVGGAFDSIGSTTATALAIFCPCW